jgi:uncharacterized membrane protein
MQANTERGLSKMRIEALSDGVFAIALTLLILEVKVPSIEPGREARHFLAGHLCPLAILPGQFTMPPCVPLDIYR